MKQNPILFFIFLVSLIFASVNIALCQDEFEEFSELTDSTSSGGDEFESFDTSATDSEFGEFKQEDTKGKVFAETGKVCKTKKNNSQLWWVLGALGLTLLSGFLVRYQRTRNMRGLVLLISLIVFGFYIGGCPCPVMSLHHVILAIAGISLDLIGMVWFLGLILITYLVGKVWCGWVCHLGALQEFLYLPGKIKVLQSENAQKIMRWIRIGFLVALIVQIYITRTNLFKTIDPFKVAFNLDAANMTGWILLGLLLVSSYFMYRPFCKTICPIGLVLGWVAKIPGASILAPQSGCTGCNICDTSCSINAITREHKISKIDNQECIACGNCIGDCKKGSMNFVRKNKNYDSKSICTRS
jgi:polyferredoxin